MTDARARIAKQITAALPLVEEGGDWYIDTPVFGQPRAINQIVNALIDAHIRIEQQEAAPAQGSAEARSAQFDASVLAETIRSYIESGFPSEVSQYSPLGLLIYNLGWWDGKHEPTRTLTTANPLYMEGRRHPEFAPPSVPQASAPEGEKR